jgi:phosphatidate cytidylyltransferase
MKKYVERLLIFFLGLPAVAGIIIFLPQARNLGIVSVICIFSGLGGMEAAGFFRRGRSTSSRTMGVISGFLVPAMEFLMAPGYILANPEGFSGGLCASAALCMVILARLAFSRASELDAILDRALPWLFPIIYPGALSTFLVRIGALEGGQAYYLLFFAMVFGNDSLAWAFGMLLGRRRNIVPASPNKSVAGFIGGILASLIIGVLGGLLFPDRVGGGALAWGLSGLVVGVAAILGDLAESGLKRASGLKDSGSIIIGRGGVLDSIDSILFAAPVFLACALTLEALAKA